MTRIYATVTSKGQVTLPVVVRRHLGVGEHQTVIFEIEEDGTVKVIKPPYPTLESLRGSAGTLPDPKPWNQVLAEAREDRLLQKYPPCQ